eukprot:10858130-Lingulodinium_polyedra.AAC.1
MTAQPLTVPTRYTPARGGPGPRWAGWPRMPRPQGDVRAVYEDRRKRQAAKQPLGVQARAVEGKVRAKKT